MIFSNDTSNSLFEETLNDQLIGKWDLYYHLPYNKKWDLSSYTLIFKDIDSIDKMMSIQNALSETVIKQSMLFVMRSNITPTWEDEHNKNGGCFSFKVINKYVMSVWTDLFYSLCGETIFAETKQNELITGITISPKKHFCIIKIWMKNCSIQDANLIVSIPNLTKQGCLFRKHEAEF